MTASSEHTSQPAQVLVAEVDKVSQELQEIFREEAREHFDEISNMVEGLHDPANQLNAAELIRKRVHTLKGAAGAVGFQSIYAIARDVEKCLDGHTELKLELSSELVQDVLTSIEIMHDLSFEGRSSGKLPKLPIPNGSVSAKSLPAMALPNPKSLPKPKSTSATSWPTVERRSQPVPAASAEQKSIPESTGEVSSDGTIRIPVRKLEQMTRVLGDLIVNRSSIEHRASEFASFLQELRLATTRISSISRELDTHLIVGISESEKRALARPSASESRPASAMFVQNDKVHGEFDTLEMDRYSNLSLVNRSLQETSSDVSTLAAELQTIVQDINQLLVCHGKLCYEIQEGLMRSRMLPIRNLEQRLHSEANALAKSGGKQVSLSLTGEDVRLERPVFDCLGDILSHLVRNAIEHGIETPTQRTSHGKSATGNLTISVDAHGTEAIVRLQDDGNGLDVEAIRDRAVAVGLVSEQRAEMLSRVEVFDFIFAPKFTTGDLTGRQGVIGLDNVRDAIKEVQGSISVDSMPGMTEFTLRLPMNLSLTKAFLMRLQESYFAVPMHLLRQVNQLNEEHVEVEGDRKYFKTEAARYPLYDLANWLEVSPSTSGTKSRGNKVALIVQFGGREVAISADSVTTSREIAVKQFGTHIQRIAGFNGATMLGNDKVVPILDLPEIISLLDGNAPNEKQPATPVMTRIANGSRTIMVVDDSVSVRRVTANLLQRAGWRVLAAKDGVDALEQLQVSERPQLFLLDVEMPRMDGFEFLATIRQMDEFKQTPVVFITSRSGEKHRRKGIELGASDYLVKPFQEDTLLALARKLIDRHRRVTTEAVHDTAL